MLAESTTFTARAGTPPKVTEDAAGNWAPCTTTVLPPPPGPWDSVTAETENEGAAWRVRAETREDAWRSGFVTVTSRAPAVAVEERSKVTEREEEELNVVITFEIPFVPAPAEMATAAPE